jgi:CBS domain-containing protein
MGQMPEPNPPDRSRLGEVAAVDAMRAGVLTCPPETPLTTVARLMSQYRVHAIVVAEPADEADATPRPWAVLSDLDLVRANATGTDNRTAGAAATEEALTVDAEDSLEQVAQLMAQEGIGHVVVVDRTRDRPLGVVSTLDLADVLAGRRE